MKKQLTGGSRLIDEVIQCSKINDAELARRLSIDPGTISKARRMEHISADLTIKLMRYTCWPLAEFDRLAPPARDAK